METKTLSDKTMVKVLKALRPKDYDRTNYYIFYSFDEDGKKKIIKSEVKLAFNKVFSQDLFTKKVEQVTFEKWEDDNFVKHSIAVYDENKVYLQALNIFQANAKFNLFNQREKEKN